MVRDTAGARSWPAGATAGAFDTADDETVNLTIKARA
jgi:hypothetical protein